MLDLGTEKKIFKKGYRLIAGIDEAGRGPLAGPVVAACIIIDNKFEIKTEELKKIKDSKKVSAKKRQELFEIIKKEFELGIGICDQQTIDRINILEASFLAMKKAVSSLRTKPDFLMIDGKFPLPNSSYAQEAFIKGDEYIFAIAAASIVAKVTRDNIMQEMHQKFPEYAFDQHKGYGTKLHMEQIKKYGPCPIHRQTFKPIKKFAQ